MSMHNPLSSISGDFCEHMKMRDLAINALVMTKKPQLQNK